MRTLQEAASLSRAPLYAFFRALGRPKLLPLAMTFVVTNRCNSRCATCQIGARHRSEQGQPEGELTLEQYTRLFQTVGRPVWVTLSGGEPFMRSDFADLAVELVRHARPAFINIPTNGTFLQPTVRAMTRLLEDTQRTRFVVNFSIDHKGVRHDELRGTRSNTELLRSTMEALRALRSPRLTLGVNTVLSRFNIEDASQIFDYVWNEVRPDSYVVEPAQRRAEYYNEQTEIEADPCAIRAALADFVRRAPVPATASARLVQAFRGKYYEDRARATRGDGGHACYSGFAACTVMPRGEVWSNTQRADRMGDLVEHDFDFGALWFAAEADRVRARVRAEPCHCETSNASHCNALVDPSVATRVLWSYLRSYDPGGTHLPWKD